MLLLVQAHAWILILHRASVAPVPPSRHLSTTTSTARLIHQRNAVRVERITNAICFGEIASPSCLISHVDHLLNLLHRRRVWTWLSSILIARRCLVTALRTCTTAASVFLGSRRHVTCE